MSMWNDIIIGEGNSGNSAFLVRDLTSIIGEVYGHGCTHISDNRTSFWVSHAIFDTGITIFKNSPEGVALAAMIKDKEEDSVIADFLDGLVLQNLGITELKQKIINYGKAERENGRSEQMRFMRKALGL